MSKLKTNEIAPFSGTTIGVGGPSSEPGAIVDVKSTTQGILIPRMTQAQRDQIASPKDGLLVYNTDSKMFENYNSSILGWETVTGIQRFNGLFAKQQTFTTGTDGVAPNFDTSGAATHVLNIPMAATAAVEAGLLSNGQYEDFNNRLHPIKNTVYVVKNSILGPQDYNSIKEAIDDISDASVSNPYIVMVGPGVFTENQIQMKPYVWVQGSEQDQTIIQPQNATVSLILGAPNSGISKCLITGVTGSGVGAIKYQSPDGTDRTSFFVEDVRFGANDTHVIADSTDSPCAVFIEEGRFGGNYQFNTGFIARAGGRIVMRNSTTTSVTSPVPADVFFATGAGSEIVINGVQLRNGNAAAGNAIRMRDGARLRCLSFNIKGWAKGVWLENAGTACFIDVQGILCDGNTMDLVADHPGSDGTFAGSADHGKIFVNTDSPLSVVIACNANPSDNTGQVVVGSVLQGDRYDRLANLSKIARVATTLGVDEQEEDSFIEIVSGLNINVKTGSGFLNDPTDKYIKEISWSDTPLTLTANTTVFVYVDTNGTVQAQSSLPSLETVIPLGRVSTNGTGVRFIEDSDLPMNHIGNKLEFFLRNTLGPVFSSGCVITENATPRKLDNTAGSYSYGVSQYIVGAGTAIAWEKLYRNGSGGFTSVASEDTVSNTQYDNGTGTLAAIPAGKFVKHHLYAIGEDGGQKWFLIQAQEVYDTLDDAIAGALPVVPSFISEAVVRVAGVVVQEGVANIAQVVDLRPRIGFAAPAGSSTSDHGELTGLLDDDHTQYLLVGGSRAMAGNLNMGGQNITNVGTVDGVDVSAHASRHLPNGADPITTAAPSVALSASSTNAEGIANSLARSDHSHDISTGAVSQQVPDQVNAEGSSANLARADHIHNIPTAAPTGSLSATSANTQGVAATFARSDHLHDVATGTAVTLTPDLANAEGSSANLSRADHVHAIPSGAPVTIGSANSAGSAASFAKSDHVHAHGAQAGGTQHAVATTSVAGFMSAADKTKLDGIESGATADQIASEVPFSPTGGLASTDVQAALAELDSEKQAISEKGQANGYASLDGSGKVPVAQLPDTVVGSVDYRGTWNANTNVPNLITATPDKGDYYVVSVAGSTSLGGITDWKIGDWAIYNGTAWEKVDNTDQVSSVFGRQGTVTAQDADYTASQVVYSNASSGLAATRVQAAIDEVESRLDTAESLLNNHDARHLPNGADPLATAAAVTIGTANAEGTANSFARSDHVHNHGAQTDGSHHAAATTSVNGFMSSTDKTKLNGLDVGHLAYSNSGAQTPSSTSFASLTLDTDRESFANSLFTKVSGTDFRADFDGQVEISYKVMFTIGTNDRAAEAGIQRNSTDLAWTISRTPAQNTSFRASHVNGTFILNCSNGDIFRLRFRSTEGTATNIDVDWAYMQIRVYRKS